MLIVAVDYTVFGHCRVVAATLYPEPRRTGHVGSRVRVTSDNVAARYARVTATGTDGREATLELLDDAD